MLDLVAHLALLGDRSQAALAHMLKADRAVARELCMLEQGEEEDAGMQVAQSGETQVTMGLAAVVVEEP